MADNLPYKLQSLQYRKGGCRSYFTREVIKPHNMCLQYYGLFHIRPLLRRLKQ